MSEATLLNQEEAQDYQRITEQLQDPTATFSADEIRR